MDIRTLTGKKIKVGIKRGMTVEDFCQKYECGPEDLWEKIGRFFPVKDTAQQIWHEIEANDKLKKSRKSKAITDDSVSKAGAVCEMVADVEESTEDKVTVEAPHIPTLDELKATEASYSSTVMDLEKTYKDCRQEREKGREVYQQLRNDIHKLKREYEAKWHEAQKIIQRDNELVDQMNEICAEHRAKQATLGEIREKIEEMSKIVICVYNTREIALFDETVEASLDDVGHDELFSQLRDREEAEDFRPRDLRVVARIIRIVANSDAPVEIIFEDEEVKKAYDVFAG